MGFFKTKSHALKDVAAKIFLPVALSAALLVGTIGGMNSVFAAENEYDMANNDGKYYSDYSSLEETWDASLEVNRQIAEESVVLLKNQNDTLPLSGVKYISVFGKDSADFYYAGGGSGTAEGYYDDDQYYTLDRSLADAGYSVNPVLRRFYENDSLSGSYSAGGNYVNETDPSKFTAGVLDSYDRYSDAALIVLGRTGSEGGDLYMGGYDGEDNELKHALELTDAEANLVKHVTANFDTVIVVLNVPMQMELGWIDAEEGDPEYLGDIDAAFWIGHTGLNGAIAVGETLNGTINPSGKLADIYARDFKKDPTYFNAQDNLHIQDGTTDYQYKEGETTWLVHSVEYEEGMNHTGLRSNTNNFELLTGVLREEWGFKGYTVTDVVPASPANSYADTETLCRTGIDTILGAGNEDAGPTQGEWDADASNMWGGKGSVIVASGDQNDITYASVRNSAKRILYTSVNTAANKNGFQGYELDAGSYAVNVCRSAHDIVDSIAYRLDADVTYPEDPMTHNTVENRFDDVSEGLSGPTMSRADWEGTFPAAPTYEERSVTKDFIKSLTWTYADRDDESKPYYTEEMPATGSASEEAEIMLYDLIGKDHDDPLWDEFLDQLSVSEMAELIGTGCYSTARIDRIDKPLTTDLDGPVGFVNFFGNSDVYDVCGYASECVIGATWNVELAHDLGISVGNESLIGNEKGDGKSYSGWYAPGVNIHRSPFGGRNSEYFSEDGLLSGKMAAAEIAAVTSKGVYTQMKHFALNEQETHRNSNGILTWANEQTIREIYLEPFQIAVQEGGSMGLMSSFNRIGTGRVLRIEAEAFAGADAVVFPLSLRSVADGAFRGSSVQSAYIFDDLESIGEGAFADCDRLETLLINAAEPPRYTSYWTGCWADKYDRLLLADPDEKQMVFFSGSSMSNGLNSAMVDESFGYEYKITNLGLSYLIDPTLQFEILLQVLHEGDILIHAPEDLSDVESLCDFNSLTWRVLEFNYDLLRYADIGEHNDVFDTFTEYNEQRQDLPANSYDEGAEEYNEYGDLAVVRPNTDDTDKGYDTYYDGEMLRPEILQQLDGFYVDLQEKGGVVYFSYGPANLEGEKMPPVYERYRYAARIEAYIVSVPIISSMEAYLYRGRYFSNTNFHLSTEGANMRTEQLIADIRQQMIKDGLLTEDA